MDKLFFVVEQAAAGKRLDVYLSESMEDVSRSRIKELIDKGLITMGDKPVKAGYSVREGNAVEVVLPDVAELDLTPEDIPIDVVYEDEYLAVVNKAQGMVVHPAQGSESGTLVNALLFRLNSLSGINGVARPGIVHRLDKDTSGLLVVAKTDEAHRGLAAQIAAKTANRRYVAIVDGNIKEDAGTIDAPVGRNPRDRKLMAVVEGGRNATTDFAVLERFGKYTLVEFILRTGRTHQIRVHCKYIKHPVAGDVAYSGSNEFKVNGQLLHAYKLSFTHPVTGEAKSFFAPPPETFMKALRVLNSNYIFKP